MDKKASNKRQQNEPTLALKNVGSNRRLVDYRLMEGERMKSSRLLVAVAASFLVAIVAHAADSASISGKIAFDGTPPKVKKIKTDADAKCAEMHADSPLLAEDVVVNSDGTLKNVFVYIKSGLGDKTYEPPKTPVELHQTG